MDESDLEPEEPLSRLLVDQIRAGGGEAIELGPDVVDLVGDMVHARPAAGEELADGGLVTERREQLDPAGADEHGRGLDALVFHNGAVLELGAEQTDVGLERLVQVMDGHAEMVNAAGLHGSMLPSALAAKRPSGILRRLDRQGADCANGFG